MEGDKLKRKWRDEKADWCEDCRHRDQPYDGSCEGCLIGPPSKWGPKDAPEEG